MIPTRNPSCVWLVTELQFIVLSCIVNYQILNHMLYHDLKYERYNPLTPYFLHEVNTSFHLNSRVVARAIDQLSILGTDQTGKFGIRNVGKPWSLKTKNKSVRRKAAELPFFRWMWRRKNQGKTLKKRDEWWMDQVYILDYIDWWRSQWC